MPNYIKLKCIDCQIERIVEIPADGFLKCPKCGRFAVIPTQKNFWDIKVEGIINLYGKHVLDDLPHFCQLLEDALAQAGYDLDSWEIEDIDDLRNNPQQYAYLSTATQQDYKGYAGTLMEAIYEALGIETVTKRERGIAFVPPTPPLPPGIANHGAKQTSTPSPATKSKPKTKPSAPPTPKPAPTPVVHQSPPSTLKRFVLPNGKTAQVNCVLDATISGWDKGRYVVRFRTGYPCAEGENPKDAVFEIASWGSSGSTTIKSAHLNDVRRISASTRTFSSSDLIVEFFDGTPSLLVSVQRGERKELDKLLEIARYNGRA